MGTQVAAGIWFHTRAEVGILSGVTLQHGAAQEIGRLHYTTGQELGRTDLFEWAREIDAYHRDHNGWLGFGYSFAVGRDVDPQKAHILEGRGWGAIGAHTLGHNEDLGVAFMGNDDPNVADATPGVLRALRLLYETPTNGKIGNDRRALREVHGHRETYQTDCPGDELEAWKNRGLPVTWPNPNTQPPAPITTSWVATGKFGLPKGHPICYAWLAGAGYLKRTGYGAWVLTGKGGTADDHPVSYAYMAGIGMITRR